jgi:hypothetical protein
MSEKSTIRKMRSDNVTESHRRTWYSHIETKVVLIQLMGK